MGRPSDSVVRGDACAPQRSLFYALGLTEEELWQKGFNLDDWEIGIDRIKTWRV